VLRHKSNLFQKFVNYYYDVVITIIIIIIIIITVVTPTADTWMFEKCHGIPVGFQSLPSSSRTL